MSDTPRETRSQDPDDPQHGDARNRDVQDQDVRDGDVRDGATQPGTDNATPDTGTTDRGADPADRGPAAASSDASRGEAAGGSRVGDERADVSGTNDTVQTGQTSNADDSTQVMEPVDESGSGSRRVTREELYARDDRRGEQERLDAVRADHEAANTPAEPVPAAAATTETSGRHKRLKYPRTTDRFLPSLGLLLLRLTMAVVFGLHGVQKLLTMEQTSEFFSSLSLFGMALPYPSVLALATGVAEVMIAVALAFGFLVRLASVGVLLITIGALLMVKMTSLPNPLEPGASGISGELELVLAGGGALLLCIGGGAWALDRLFRRGRYSKDPNDLVA